MDIQNMCSQNQNPLEIPLILEQICEFLTVKDLKSTRQVSQFWHDCSNKKWRSSTVIKISDENLINELINYVQERNHQGIPSGFCTDNFYVEYENEQFWKICGKFIKKLELDCISFSSENNFQNAIYDNCPNLVELILTDIDIDTEEEESDSLEEPEIEENWNLKSLTVSSPYFCDWTAAFQHYPGIEILILQNAISDCFGLFTSLTTMRKDFPEKLKLKQLETKDSWPDSAVTLCSKILFELLTDSSLSFETLSFKVEEGGHEQTERIKSIFTTHRSSLKKLSIEKDKYSIPYYNPYYSFPGKLENLQVLELHNQVFTNLTYLKFTPNLKKLMIHNQTCEAIRDTKVGDMIGVKLEKCKELRLHYLSKDCEYEDFEKINEWLPNIEKLVIGHLTNENFSSICQLWPKITSLNIEEGYINDAGISGWDEEDVKEINKNGAKSNWKPTGVQRANLASLQNLRHLSLHAADNENAVGYPDLRVELGHCASLGILEVPKLDSLTLQNYNSKLSIWKSIFEKHPWTDKSKYFPVH